MHGHGCRALFSSIANNHFGDEQRTVVEHALHHLENDDVAAAYNKATYLEKRAELMQWWADELQRLEAGKASKVISIHRGGL